MIPEESQSSSIFLISPKASPIHLKMLTDIMKSQNKEKDCPALKKKHLNSNCLRPQLPQTSSFEPSSQLRPQLGPVKNFRFLTRIIFPPPINLLPQNTYKISVLPKESVCPIQNILIDKHVLEMSLDCYFTKLHPFSPSLRLKSSTIQHYLLKDLRIISINANIQGHKCGSQPKRCLAFTCTIASCHKIGEIYFSS